MITLTLTGDVTLSRGVDEELRTMPPEEVWDDTLPLLKSAALRIINLERAVTSYRKRWTRTSKVFHFRTPRLLKFSAWPA